MVPVPKEPVTQVVFVEDYLQVVFQDECFSFYDPVEVTSDRRLLTHGQSGFCDALVGLIGERAVAVAADENEQLTVVFGSGAALRTRPDLGTCPEAWQFNGSDGQIVVGRAS